VTSGQDSADQLPAEPLAEGQHRRIRRNTQQPYLSTFSGFECRSAASKKLAELISSAIATALIVAREQKCARKDSGAFSNHREDACQ
jgi:hypothetical protein